MDQMWAQLAQRSSNPPRRLAIWIPAFAGTSGMGGPYRLFFPVVATPAAALTIQPRRSSRSASTAGGTTT